MIQVWRVRLKWGSVFDSDPFWNQSPCWISPGLFAFKEMMRGYHTYGIWD